MPVPTCSSSSVVCTLPKEHQTLRHMQEWHSAEAIQSAALHHHHRRPTSSFSPVIPRALRAPVQSAIYSHLHGHRNLSPSLLSTAFHGPGALYSNYHAPPPPLPVAPTINRILTTVIHLADTVGQLSKQLEVQTEVIDKINGQLDRQMTRIEWISDQGNWMVRQVDEIKRQNARLEIHAESSQKDMKIMDDIKRQNAWLGVHAKSIQNDMKMAMEHLVDLREDNGGIEEQLEILQESLGKAGNSKHNPIYIG